MGDGRTKPVKTHLSLQNSQAANLPAAFAHDDVRYPESLVEHFLKEYTQPGATVLDPFAGYGTTLLVAERLGRVAYGVEFDEARVSYARSRLAKPVAMIHGDSRALDKIELPPIDFSISSPPYMNREDLEDPFSAYTVSGDGYAGYLRDIRDIYKQLKRHMQPDGTVVIEVANLKTDGRVTTLAWDVAQAVSQELRFAGELVVCWDKYGYGYDHSYCLIFTVQ